MTGPAGALLQEAIDVVARREQVILLMNRRGYASYVFCPKCDWILACDNCTRAMVFHQATQLAMCHYCQHTSELPEHCPACRKKCMPWSQALLSTISRARAACGRCRPAGPHTPCWLS